MSSAIRFRAARVLTAALAFMTVVALSGSAQAADFGFKGFGPRVGVSTSPEQLVLGVHIDLGEIDQNLLIRPNFMFGTGDDEETYSLNCAVLYMSDQNWGSGTPYGGGSLGYTTREIDGPRGSEFDEDGIAVDLIAGTEWNLKKGARFFAEANVGVGEKPRFRLLAGWTF